MKNLLVLAPNYASFVKGVVDELSEHFKNIYVIIPTPIYPSFLRKIFGTKYDSYIRPKFQKYKNIKIYYPRYLHLPIKYFRRKLVSKHFNSAFKIIKENNIKFDFIHAHFTWPSGSAAIFLKEIFNVPLITTAHGFDIYKLPSRNQFWKNLIISVLESSDVITTVSNSNFEIIKRMGFAKKARVIPNGFDPNLFKILDKNLARKKLGLSTDKKIVLNVANLYEVKNQKTLLFSFKEILKFRRDVLLYIVGGGHLRTKLERMSRFLGINSRVFFVGPRPHEEISLWMNAADVFVLPSYNEGNPTVLFEAFACGLPFIGTRVGGIPEIIISEDYGFLLDDPDDYNLLAELINKALDKKWDKDKILKYAKRFSWRVVVKEYLKIFKQMYRCG